MLVVRIRLDGRKGVTLAPTLAREDAELAFAQESNPYLENALFRKCAGNRLDELRKIRINSSTTLEELPHRLELALTNFETLTRAGVRVCLSTDSGFKMKLGGFAQHRELELMCSAGFSPSNALQTALGNNQKLFAKGSGANFKKGRRADSGTLGERESLCPPNRA
jgi:imidazolonepropionase-like amidohydrolase